MTTFTDLVPARSGTWLAQWTEAMQRMTDVTNALEGMSVTSATVLTPAAGALAFTTDQSATERPLAVGTTVRARSAADPSIYAVGTLTAFAGTALTVNATIAAGGEASDWIIGYDLSVAAEVTPADFALIAKRARIRAAVYGS